MYARSRNSLGKAGGIMPFASRMQKVIRVSMAPGHGGGTGTTAWAQRCADPRTVRG